VADASADSGNTKPASLYRQFEIWYPINMSYKDKDEELEKMKASLEKVIDINYRRYNNEYMDLAFDREVEFRKSKGQEGKRLENDAAEEASSDLYGIMKGRKDL